MCCVLPLGLLAATDIGETERPASLLPLLRMSGVLILHSSSLKQLCLYNISGVLSFDKMDSMPVAA